MNGPSTICPMWGIVYRDTTTHFNNILMYSPPGETDYIKWRPVVSIPFMVHAYNTPGAPMLFSSKDEAMAYIVEEGMDKFQNAPYVVTIHVKKETAQ